MVGAKAQVLDNAGATRVDAVGALAASGVTAVPIQHTGIGTKAQRSRGLGHRQARFRDPMKPTLEGPGVFPSLLPEPMGNPVAP